MSIVLIVGAGIAGCTLALELKKRNISSIVFEAKSREECYEGLFIGITPNGLNVLKNHLNLEDLVEKGTSGKMVFYNAKDQVIGELDNENQLEKYGSKTYQFKRAHLLENLHYELELENIPIFFQHKVSGYSEKKNCVNLQFENNRSFSGDLIIGCDGMHSKMRQLLFPNAPKPVYTKQISTGGFTKSIGSSMDLDHIKMIFGKKAFFAFAQSNDNEIWWFNNYYREIEPTKNEVKTTLQKEIKSALLDLHKDDPYPIFEIVEKTENIFAYPVYEYTELRKWHSNRVCLIGDAAHATSPHIGQGASLAMEDAAYLAKLLKESTIPEMAFKDFQNHRKPRVQKLIRQARKVGGNKSKANLIKVFFRDLFLKYFIKIESKKMDWVYSYKIQ